MTALRDQLLAGRTIALSGRAHGAAVRDRRGGFRDRLLVLGAALSDLDAGDALDDQQLLESVVARAPLDGVVHDARDRFGPGGHAGLTAALDEAWRVVAAVANGALIPSGKGGTAVLIAPPASAGAYAGAARAALENLARTLSVEWARYGITSTAIWPGDASGDDDLAELVAFLLSPAGGYYSGCRFELGAV